MSHSEKKKSSSDIFSIARYGHSSVVICEHFFMTDPGFPSFQVGIMAMLVYPPVNHQSYGNSCFFLGNDLFFAWRVSTKLPKFQPKNITFGMNRQHPSIEIFAETWSMKALSNSKKNTWIWYWNGTSMSTLYICQWITTWKAMNRPPMARKNTMNFTKIPNSESDSPKNLPFVRSARERAWEPPRRWVKIQCGAPFAIAKLVNITSKAMVYDTYNISYKYSFKFHKHTYWMV